MADWYEFPYIQLKDLKTKGFRTPMDVSLQYQQGYCPACDKDMGLMYFENDSAERVGVCDEFYHVAEGGHLIDDIIRLGN